MAADLHIHVRTPEMTDADFRCFFGSTLGSRWFTGFFGRDVRCKSILDCPHWTAISKSPNIWIGEVSWLKAGITGDAETYVPATVERISELVGENFLVLDEALIGNILDAFGEPGHTYYNRAKAEEVQKFLEEHFGKPVFTVSW